MSALDLEAQKLVDEFQQHVGLKQTDAYRSAFVALALTRHWSKARIARFLGVSRARIGQKVNKFRRYVEGDSADKMPVLTDIILKYDADGHSNEEDGSVSVEFSSDKWDDPDFAVSLLNRIVKE